MKTQFQKQAVVSLPGGWLLLQAFQAFDKHQNGVAYGLFALAMAMFALAGLSKSIAKTVKKSDALLLALGAAALLVSALVYGWQASVVRAAIAAVLALVYAVAAIRQANKRKRRRHRRHSSSNTSNVAN